MPAHELHRGRLIDHVQLVVSDLERSRVFYTAVLAPLGVPVDGSAADHFWADELFVSTLGPAGGQLTGRVHIAFQARDRGAVRKFHDAGLRNGGRDNGPPGERAYHPGCFAAFLLDPDGNNIEAVHHGSGERSAESVRIKL